MKTVITRFCEACLLALAPLLPALKEATERTANRDDLASTHRALSDLEKRLLPLTEKLGNQQTFLVIFGPLKSGKSTLMNAICGTFVSEVTSLPGYPALVYVQHAAEKRFSATRFNGRESVFADAATLSGVIADSHLALVKQLRSAEDRGVEFDPQKDFSESIRRIDIRVPIARLATSGTVLVDTPGLYSRTNFAYDTLTHEFRDHAACAVFVVKTDHLFLEPIFAEFNRLLESFTRILLVVNVDSGKRDLQPDGTLRPSAESQNPQRIIEAFRAFSMAGPMRLAHQEGRVHIHAIDLMQAATAQLCSERSETHDKSLAAFDGFMRDLTSFLDSGKYTQGFISDTLRQSHSSCADVDSIITGAEVKEVRKKQEAAQATIDRLDTRIALYDRLLAQDWSGAYTATRVENVQSCRNATQNASAALRHDLHAALDRWYGTTDSLKSLEQQYWNPLLRQTCAALGAETVQHLRSVLTNATGGASLPSSTVADLRTIELDLKPFITSALEGLQVREVEPCRISIRPDSLPLSRDFSDRAFLRSNTSIAERLFGADRTSEIAPSVKYKRLSNKSRNAFVAFISSTVEDKFPEAPARSASYLLERYIEKFTESITGELRQRREKVVKERAKRNAPSGEDARVIASLQKLLEEASKARAALGQISKKPEAESPQP